MSSPCTNCGLCCTYMGSPPLSIAEYQMLPLSLRDELDGWLDSPRFAPDGPCLWLDLATGACRHYEHRPEICREFEVGNATCRKLRTEAHPPLTIEGLPPEPVEESQCTTS